MISFCKYYADSSYFYPFGVEVEGILFFEVIIKILLATGVDVRVNEGNDHWPVAYLSFIERVYCIREASWIGCWLAS